MASARLAAMAIVAALALGLMTPLALGSVFEEQVKLATSIEQMRSHLLASRENLEAGELGLAKAHASHLEEHWPLVRGGIAKADSGLSSELEESIKELVGAKDAGGLKSAIERVDGLLADAIERAVHESLLKGFVFRVRVIASLLEGAIDEYGEALEEGKVTDREEHQDAIAFTKRASLLYNGIKGAIEADEAKEIEGFFKDLLSSMDKVASPRAVEAIANGILRELAEASGLEFKPKEGPQAVIANIRELLERSIEEYKEGELGEAEELAIEAYLENYEHIESSVKKLDPELNEEIEEMLREEFRAMIKERAPIEELEGLAKGIMERLERAEALLLREPSAIPKEEPREAVKPTSIEAQLIPWQMATGVLVAIVAFETIIIAKRR